MADSDSTRSTESDTTVVGAVIADDRGVLAEGAVAVQGDHALVVARFADMDSARAIYDGLLRSEIDGTLHIDGVLVVNADSDGRLHVQKMTDHSTRTGLKWGIVGGVVAGIFLPRRSSRVRSHSEPQALPRARPETSHIGSMWRRNSRPSSLRAHPGSWHS